MWLDDIDECARYESEHVVNGERQRGRVLRDVTVLCCVIPRIRKLERTGTFVVLYQRLKAKGYVSDVRHSPRCLPRPALAPRVGHGF